MLRQAEGKVASSPGRQSTCQRRTRSLPISCLLSIQGNMDFSSLPAISPGLSSLEYSRALLHDSFFWVTHLKSHYWRSDVFLVTTWSHFFLPPQGGLSISAKNMIRGRKRIWAQNHLYFFVCLSTIPPLHRQSQEMP